MHKSLKFDLMSMLYTVFKQPASFLRIILFVFVFFYLPSFMILGSWIDNTLFIEGSGIGLFEHYGMWGFIITNPIIFALSIYCWMKTIHVFRHLNTYLSHSDNEIKSFRRYAIRTLFGKTKVKSVYFAMVMAGLLASITNILQTIDPMQVYGNDVFDAASHTAGYMATKCFLFATFTLVYPISFYLTVKSLFLLYIAMKLMTERKTIAINYFHHDMCGGLSVFGHINLIAMCVLLMIYSVIFMLLETHASIYLSVQIPLLVTSLAIFALSFIGVHPVHNAIKKNKIILLTSVNKILNDSLSSPEGVHGFPNKVFSFRNHLINVHTYPYAGNITWLVNVVRFIPSLIALYKISIN